MKDVLVKSISFLSAIVSLVVGGEAVVRNPIMGIILLIVGITAGAIFIYKYQQERKLPFELKVLNHEVVLDFQDPNGDFVIHSRKTCFKCLANEVTTFTDHMSADGEFKNPKVSLGTIEKVRREGGDLFITTNFGKVLYKNDVVERIIKADLLNSFHNKPEYWSVRIILPTDKFVLKVIFHKDRPYTSMIGYQRITSHERIAKIQPKQLLIDGRPGIEWEVLKPEVKDVYKLQWDW